MDEAIGVSDCLDSFGGFPIDVNTASADVWQGFSFTNFKTLLSNQTTQLSLSIVSPAWYLTFVVSTLSQVQGAM